MPFTKIKPTFLSLKCLEWKDTHFKEYERCTKQLLEISRKAGTTSDAFEQAVKNINFLATWRSTEEFFEAIQKPIHVRAVMHLLLSSDTFRQKIPISQRLLSALEKPLGRITNLTLMSLVRLWFDYFDKLGTPDVLNMLGTFLSNQIEIKSDNIKCSSEIQNLHKFSNYIFKSDGPSRIVKSIIQPYTLDDIFSKPGLQGYEDGRFQNICRMLYYIETLKSIPVGTDHSVLSEVIKREVCEAPFDGKLLIGHQVLSILIDRSPEEGISDSWQNVILTIAGDPRVPKASPRYQKWWAYMSTAQLAKMFGWLSREDLKLFLETLQEYGLSSGNLDLQRMFPSRKQFLEGLINQNLVTHSRLFISRQADRFIRRKRSSHLISYAKVNNSQISLIYLQVNNCIMIEGTHSFKLSIFSRKPQDLPLLDYNKDNFSVDEIRYNTRTACHDEFNNNFDFQEIMHHPSKFSWQNKAINFLRKNDVRIDLEEMFDPNEYRQFIRIHGA